MIEQYLVEHCAPTLASMKTANLFSCRCGAGQELEENVKYWDEILKRKGISVRLLRKSGGRALVYVYRRALLERDLRRPGVFRLLQRYGYTSRETGYALDRLSSRLDGGSGFPHEIGLFLGYPLADVTGFIENRAGGCKYTGCWKVYGNVRGAMRAFARFDRCRRAYLQLWRGGRSIIFLAVDR